MMNDKDPAQQADEASIRARFTAPAPAVPAPAAPAPAAAPAAPAATTATPAAPAPAAAPHKIEEGHPHTYNWLKACPYCGEENPDFGNKEFDAECPWCGKTIDKKEPHCHNCGVTAGTDGACKGCGRPVSMAGDECPECHSKDAYSLQNHRQSAIDALVARITKRKSGK